MDKIVTASISINESTLQNYLDSLTYFSVSHATHQFARPGSFFELSSVKRMTKSSV